VGKVAKNWAVSAICHKTAIKQEIAQKGEISPNPATLYTGTKINPKTLVHFEPILRSQ
jgi:hypothetical protein